MLTSETVPPECKTDAVQCPTAVETALAGDAVALLTDVRVPPECKAPLGKQLDLNTLPPQQLVARLVGNRLAKASDVMLDGLADDETVDPERAVEDLLQMMACKAAVKAGQTLGLEEMRGLVRQLEETTSPRTCPHGRPTMILLGQAWLEREFGRR